MLNEESYDMNDYLETAEKMAKEKIADGPCEGWFLDQNKSSSA